MNSMPEAKKLVFLLDFINSANKRKQRGKLNDDGINELKEKQAELKALKDKIKKS